MTHRTGFGIFAVAVAATIGLSGCVFVIPPEATDATQDDTPPGTGQNGQGDERDDDDGSDDDAQESQPGGIADPIACTTADVELDQPGVTYTLTGDCGTVTVQGADITLNAQSIGVLEISGDQMTIETGSLGTLEVRGNENTLSADQVGVMSFSGDRNVLTANQVGTVTLMGNDNSVTADQVGAVDDSGERNLVSQ